MDPNPTTGQPTLRHAIARLVAAMMVADRRLATEEIHEATRLDQIGLGPLSPLVAEELQRATRMPVDVGEACRALSGTGPALIGTVLSVLAGVAASDGAVDDDERRVFTAIAERLGAGMREIRDYLGPSEPTGDTGTAATAAATRRAVARDDEGASALRALGLGTASNATDVDAAYLRLVEQFDPTKVAPLGADFVVLAVHKLAALTELYGAARRAANG
ncbi:MAG TPA: TerB family tellurite resistance protein [Candidatus Eisenbacteria bacterium]|nr:TerB family tellurite resistance protein [Candidatus Eisenbacteria bacterium]